MDRLFAVVVVKLETDLHASRQKNQQATIVKWRIYKACRINSLFQALRMVYGIF